MPDFADLTHKDVRLAVTDGLRHVMGSTCCLSLATMIVSWNITGPGSSAFAAKLREHHQEMSEALYALAFLTKAIGAPVVADETDGVLTADTRMQLSFQPREQALRQLLDGHHKLEEAIVAAALVARNSEYHAAAALLEQRLLSHKRQRVDIEREL